MSRKWKFTREKYFAAVALDALSDQAHAMSNMLGDISVGDSPAQELADAHAIASSDLHERARKLFPLYPHDDWQLARAWLRQEGIVE
ncbi:MAG TPA: hypothetical protein VHQ87_10315 [Rhizobacter sp.]|jgi:hypothetical protein|nr:hypothetical protein [Rhizobacter sp.]